MNVIRTVLRAFAALTLALLALSAVAGPPEKIFSINLTPQSGSINLTAVIRNETPNGNSSINSLTLTTPLGITISSASLAPGYVGSLTFTAGSASTPGVISVSNMAPVKAGGNIFVVNVTIGFAGAPACGAVYTPWTAKAWTGSSFSGDTFRLLGPTETSPATNRDTAVFCGLRFVAPPKDANIDGTSTVAVVTGTANSPAAAGVSVEVWNGYQRVTSYNGTITLGIASGPSATLANASVAAQNGLAVFGNASSATPLSLDKTGSYTLVATGTGVPTASAPSPSFTVYDGILACGENLSLYSTNPGNIPEFTNGLPNPGWASGYRGASNKDGSTCVLVNYDFTNDILNSNSVTLKWNTASQPNATFSYSVNWKDETVDPNTGLPKYRRTKVGWVFGTNGLPDPTKVVPAIACLSSNLPFAYGTLAVPLTASLTNQTVVVDSTATLPAVPFPIVIGTERMQVTAKATTSTGYSLTVDRAQGGTTLAAHNGGTTGDPVMSTPLPIDPNAFLADGTTANPFYGKQVQMCIWEENWVNVGPGCDPSQPSLACVRPSTSVFDIGDGYMIR